MVKIHLPGDLGSNLGSGRYPGEGNGNPAQYSCWGIPWTEVPGGRGEDSQSQRAAHELATKHAHTHQQVGSEIISKQVLPIFHFLSFPFG